MVFEQIETLKKQFTDKYVVVDGSRPELKRFHGQTGVVRTVNMNGDALVEFDAHLNIGWFDIHPDYLKVIDKPLEKPDKPAAKKAAAKPAKKGTPKPAAKGGALSAADVLAAARGGAGAQSSSAKPADTKMSAADVLAAARGGSSTSKPAKSESAAAPAADPPKQVDPSKMSAADVLAMARGGASSAAPPPESEPAPEPIVEEAPVVEETPAPPAATAEPVGELPTEVDDILAFCRQRDGG